MSPLHHTHIALAAVATLWLSASCSSRPDTVLGQDRMVDILVDVHKAEGILEVQSEQYPSDSAMAWLVQSVLTKHGVTKADYDSSLVWYSTHLRDFIRVYNQVRVRVAAEQDSLKSLLNVEVTSPAGDSVDLWRDVPYALMDVTRYTGGQFYTVAADSNFRATDSVDFSFRLMGLPAHCRAVATLSLCYDADSMTTVDYILPAVGQEVTKALVGPQRVTLGLRADSTLSLKEVQASLYMIAQPDTSHFGPVVVDSLSLMRYR